jgi:hypothetical protein
MSHDAWLPDNSLISIIDAVGYFPRYYAGNPMHPRTIKRRIRFGYHGDRLRAVKDGGVWYTTPEWIRQHLATITSHRPVERID